MSLIGRVKIMMGEGKGREKWSHLPVMGGGSTTVEGPKKDGMSPEVVTGVLRSPVWVSPCDWDWSSDDWCRFESEEWWPLAEVVLRRLRCG